ncbi:F-box/LRR-repeat protein 12-like isoform X2 [Lycium barbarum]|uniref:F-box/LRR-repeat protein 12-like isoform X2 n=1 Tax=Lycium barbarum TaxID=112863 RepID=UPI00293F38CF|nr:F-box/LRR-repeat protein 12-like isoform X2 [Lycium barbarum]XP_060174955.1 F-box/LRR-repeat protein 12-like isoform X2 [Lycium barbarum]XP_060174956.1 F-box/LRR-repeat protein 12-like isoform X2 [Lycium barbarum]
MQLPDDCLPLIFQHLDCTSDRESFGLTCRRWLQIQNENTRSLQFQIVYPYTMLKTSSSSQYDTHMSTFQLSRLLNRFQNLDSLSLSRCTELPDSALALLPQHASKLQSLHLDFCFRITDNCFSSVASGCSLLVILSLYQCNVTDYGLEALSNSCLALEDLNVSYCSRISDYGIRAISQNCRHLRAIRISYCGNLTGAGFQGCSQTLTYLEADSCRLEPEGIQSILSGGGLEYLSMSNLTWCADVDGLGFAAKLKVLNFRMCEMIGDDCIMAIARDCPSLQEWNLAVCHGVKIGGWESIASHCHNLKTLHVNGCRNLTDQGLQALRTGCKRLSVLYITRCSQISVVALEMFKVARGNVEVKEEEIDCICPHGAFRF